MVTNWKIVVLSDLEKICFCSIYKSHQLFSAKLKGWRMTLDAALDNVETYQKTKFSFYVSIYCRNIFLSFNIGKPC